MIWRRRAAWSVAALVGTLAIALLAAEVSGWPFLQQPLRDALQRAAGVPVQLEGRFHAHLLWRPRLLVERLVVGSAAGVPAPHLIDGRQVALAWQWGDVWRWRRGDVLSLRSMRAEALDVQLVRLADGRANWQIGRAAPPRGPHARCRRSAAWWSTMATSPSPTSWSTRSCASTCVAAKEMSPSPQANGYRADITGRYRAAPVKLALSSDGALPLLRGDEDDHEAATTALRVEGTVGASRILVRWPGGCIDGRAPSRRQAALQRAVAGLGGRAARSGAAADTGLQSARPADASRRAYGRCAPSGPPSAAASWPATFAMTPPRSRRG